MSISDFIGIIGIVVGIIGIIVGIIGCRCLNAATEIKSKIRDMSGGNYQTAQEINNYNQATDRDKVEEIAKATSTEKVDALRKETSERLVAVESKPSEIALVKEGEEIPKGAKFVSYVIGVSNEDQQTEKNH